MCCGRTVAVGGVGGGGGGGGGGLGGGGVCTSGRVAASLVHVRCPPLAHGGQPSPRPGRRERLAPAGVTLTLTSTHRWSSSLALDTHAVRRIDIYNAGPPCLRCCIGGIGLRAPGDLYVTNLAGRMRSIRDARAQLAMTSLEVDRQPTRMSGGGRRCGPARIRERPQERPELLLTCNDPMSRCIVSAWSPGRLAAWSSVRLAVCPSVCPPARFPVYPPVRLSANPPSRLYGCLPA